MHRCVLHQTDTETNTEQPTVVDGDSLMKMIRFSREVWNQEDLSESGSDCCDCEQTAFELTKFPLKSSVEFQSAEASSHDALM